MNAACKWCTPQGGCTHCGPGVPKDSVCIEPKETCQLFDAKPEFSEAGKRDMVDKPKHYSRYGIETIDALKGSVSPEEFNGFLKGNLFKYLTRAGAKDDLEQDLHKVCWYAAFLYLANGGTITKLQKTCDYMKGRFEK